MRQLTEVQESYLKGLLDGGKSIRDSKDLFNKKFHRKLSTNTIWKVSNLSKKIKHHSNLPQNQRYSSGRQVRTIIRVVKENRCESWRFIQWILKEQYDIDLSISTIRRRCRENGIKGYFAKKKPKLTQRKVNARLKFAKKYRNWRNEDWDKVIYQGWQWNGTVWYRVQIGTS